MGILDWIDEDTYQAFKRKQREERERERAVTAARVDETWRRAQRGDGGLDFAISGRRPSYEPEIVPSEPTGGLTASYEAPTYYASTPKVSESDVAESYVRAGLDPWRIAQGNRVVRGGVAAPRQDNLAGALGAVGTAGEAYSRYVTAPLAESAARAGERRDTPEGLAYPTGLAEGLGTALLPSQSKTTSEVLSSVYASPETLRRAAEQWYERPEAYAGQKGIVEAVVDPANLIGLGLSKHLGVAGREVADIARRGAKGAVPVTKKAVQALDDAARSPELETIARRMGGTIEDVSDVAKSPEVEALAPKLGVEATEAPKGTKRYYHGTGSTFESPDAAKFDPNGLYGPGYYLTTDPAVASSYAEGAMAAPESIDMMKGQIEIAKRRIKEVPKTDEGRFYTNKLPEWEKELDRALNGVPQVRAVSVPENLRLLDAEAPVPAEAIASVRRQLPQQVLPVFDREMQSFGRDASVSNLQYALGKATGQGGTVENATLAAAGYDGIRYQGGKRVPMRGADGSPIEHEAIVIFPESMPKITNALSGRPMGVAPETVGAVGGLGAELTTETPDMTEEEKAQRRLTAVVGGGLTAAGLRGGIKGAQAAGKRMGRGLGIEATSTTPATQKIFDMYYGKQPGPTTSWWERVRNGYIALIRASTDNKVDLARVQDMAAKTAGRPLNSDEMLTLLSKVNPDRMAEVRLEQQFGPAVQSAGDDLPWLSAYMTAQHDKDVAAVLGNPTRAFSGGRTIADIDATLTDMPKEIGAERFAKVEQAAQQVDAFVQSLRERLLDSGVWDQRLFDELSQRYPHYVPTKILDYMKEAASIPVGKSISLRDKGLRELTEEGTERLREDPLASVVRLAYDTEARAVKNDQFNAFVKLRDLSPDLQEVVRDVPASYSATNKETIIEGFVGGKRVRLAAPKALNLVTNAESKLVLPVYSTLMNVFRALATARSPLFLFSNAFLDAGTYALRAPIREAGALDVRSAKSIGRSIAAPLYLPRVLWELGNAYVDAFKGLQSGRYAGSRTAQYLQEGGGMFGYFGGSTEQAKETVKSLARSNVFEIKDKEDVLRLAKDIALFQPIESVGERIELAPRVAQMQLGLKRGKSALGAMEEGRSVTIDFQVGGNFSKWLNSFVPFFNVGTQAVVQPVRAFKENPIAFLSTSAALIGGPLMLAEAWNRSDPQRAADYDDVPQYVKDQGIVFMLPGEPPVDARGDQRPQMFLWRWRDFGPVGIAAREAINRGMGNDSRNWQDLALRSGLSLSPIQAGTAAEAVGSVLPLGLQTAAQLTNDRDWFRDQRIATEYRDEQASALSKTVAEQLGTKPSQVEFTLRDLTGGVGNLALAASDLIAGRERSDMPQEIPVLGGIYNKFVRGNIGQQLEQARNEAYPDELRKQLLDAGVDITISPVKGIVNNTRLTLAQQSQYQQLANVYTRTALGSLLTRGSWLTTTADEREKKVRQEIEKARNKAGAEILRGMSATERQMRKAR